MWKYAFQLWGGFNLSPLILYPPAGNYRSQRRWHQKTVAWENKLYVLFFIFVFFLYTDFYDRQKYWGGGRHAIFTQFFSLSCRRHVDNSRSSLVHECRLQHRRGAMMLANNPPGIIWIWACRGYIKCHMKIDEHCELRILKRPSSWKSVKTAAFVKIRQPLAR